MTDFIITVVTSFNLGAILAGMVIKRGLVSREEANKKYYIRKGWEACEDWVIDTGMNIHLLVALRKKQGR